MEEEGFLFAGESEVEAAGFEEFFGGGDGHDFEDAEFPGFVDAGLDEFSSDADAACAGGDGEAADFGELLGIDFESGAADDFAIDEGEVAAFDECAEFGGGAGEESSLFDEGLNEGFECVEVVFGGGADDEVRVGLWVGHLCEIPSAITDRARWIGRCSMVS